MFKYTNKHNVSLAMTTFLLHDSYDHDPRSNAISATTLMKPIRQLVLLRQNPDLEKTVDVVDLVASRMGSAIHDGCEAAWKSEQNLTEALKVMGAGPDTVKRVKVNVEPEDLQEGDIPVYVEQRTEKQVGNYIITGKFDLCLDGTVNDYKSTSTWTYIYDSNAGDYTQQGSLYKWLNPHKITSEYINIQYIFTDWSGSKAKQDSNYPQLRVQTKKYPINSVEQTQVWVEEKLNQLDHYINMPQEQLPECSDDELWASPTVYKYYKNPAKKSRATKNFSTMEEAIQRQAADNNIGVIDTVHGEVRRCNYCAAVGICKQAEQLVATGRLTLS